MPPVFKGVFPVVTVVDIAKSVEFYKHALGFVSTFRWPADESADPEFVTLALENREIGIGNVEAGATPSFSNVELCLEVEDMSAAWTWLIDHGATEVQPPTAQPWGETNAYIADPDGLKIHIYCKNHS
ncbi:MAG: VOC family protein [Thermomicrobiales bacterium]